MVELQPDVPHARTAVWEWAEVGMNRALVSSLCGFSDSSVCSLASYTLVEHDTL